MDKSKLQSSSTSVKQDSKKIIKTMESVIESVSKKPSHKTRKKSHHHHHHHHHSHHDQQPENTNIDDNSEQKEILIISDALTHNLSIISPNTSLDDTTKIIKTECSTKENNNSSQNILTSKTGSKKQRKSNENKNLLDNQSPMKNSSTQNHFIPKKSETDVCKASSLQLKDKIQDNDTISMSQSPTTSSNTLNAFEMMMNARNRSIGSNSPGKELEIEDSNEKDKSQKEIISRRKQILKEWADKKGGIKRKIEEETREQYIDYKMEKRAKRLKRMLGNGKDTSEDKKHQNIDTPTDSVNITKARKSRQNEILNDNTDTDHSHKEKTLKNKNFKTEISSSTPKHSTKVKDSQIIEIDLIEISDQNVKDIPNGTHNSSLDLEFAGKLSSPIKKRDSLLGYFPKLFSPTSTTTKELSPSLSSSSKNGIVKKQILNSSDDFEKNVKELKQADDKIKKMTRRSSRNSNEEKLDSESSIKPIPEKRGRPRKLQDDIQKNIGDISEDLKLAVENLEQRPITPINGNAIQNNANEETPTAQNGRPRRSCAGKIRYDLIDKSPKKNETKSRKRERSNSKNIENMNSPCLKNSTKIKKRTNQSNGVITIDDYEIDDDNNYIDVEENYNYDSNSQLSNSEKIPRKLAPIFMKIPKPVIDPEILKARQKFLMSGVPEKLRLEIEKQKLFEQNYDIQCEKFPITEHIFQFENYNENDDDENSDNGYSTQFSSFKSSSQYKIIDWKKYGIKWRKNNDDNDEISPIKIQKNKSSLKILKYLKNENSIILPPLKKLQKIDNKQKFIKNLKNLYDKFPTYKCYNQLREKYRYFNAIDSTLETHQITDSLVVTKISKNPIRKSINNDDDDYKPPLSAPNGELLFTEKYKPMLTEQILCNLNPVNRLKEFLSSWQSSSSSSSSSSTIVNRKNSKLDTSLSDFEYTNDSSCSNSQNTVHNTVVLVGPCSSGKTNAVFAIANELNFNVLEVNAGMKRTGKKFLQDLQEATQSHQVGKDKGNNLLKQTLNGIKKKSYSSNENNSLSLENSSFNEKLSLILIEDGDIIFEQDNGFIDAINQLSSISKRPVVITVQNNDCQHLLKLINQNSIIFSSPNVLNISKFLSIISLIENCPIDLDDIVSLYLYNHKNLRKTLLEMQFFIQSGGDRYHSKENISTTVTATSKNNNESSIKSSIKSPIKPTYKSSPRKFSIEDEINEINKSQDSLNNYNELIITKKIDNKNSKQQQQQQQQNVYIHKTLFDFYTTDQNFNLRIPFPLNYNLLWSNLNDIFHVSKNLINLNDKKQQQNNNKKKNSKLSSSPLLKFSKNHDENYLKSLNDFYENISIATLISTSSIDSYHGESPNLSEEISHNLTELAIDINLKADMTAYNLFETTTERVCLTSYISSNNLTKSQRSLQLDYESCLRSICRSEKLRLQKERRTSRFYHYLRNICTTNLDLFSSNLFEKSCEIFNTENNSLIDSQNNDEILIDTVLSD